MPDSDRASLEQRLVADEARLSRDEARLEIEEAEIRESRILAWLGAALALVTLVAVAALIVAIVALRGDVGSIQNNAPANSVGASALRNGSVGTPALQDASVTTNKLAPGVVDHSPITGARVAPDSLTGAQIEESTLARVPSATDARKLGGAAASAYLLNPTEISASSITNTDAVKGPVVARCPAGARMLAGGASIEGAATGAALTSSAPEGRDAWTARARVARTPAPDWRLVVTVVCAAGGH